MSRPRPGAIVPVVLTGLFVAGLVRGGPAVAPEVGVTHRVAGKTDLENRLARPVSTVRIREPSPWHLLGRLAWLYGVDLLVDSRAVEDMAHFGESSIDVRGGDARAVLEAAVPEGMGLTVRGEELVLHRLGDRPGVGGRLSRVDVEERPSAIGHLVEGVVVDARGRPVAGALVAGEEFPPARTDENGRFRCRLARAGGRLRAWMAGRLPSEPVEGSSGVRLRIGPRVASIVVRPVDAESGEVVPDALVRWERRGEVRCSGPSRRSGQVEIGGLATGDVALLVAGRGHGARACTVPARRGKIATVTIRLSRATLAERLRSERLEVKVDGQQLAVALWELAKRAAIPIRFAPSLRPEIARRPVSVELPNATLGEALQALCDAGKVAMRADEEAAFVRIEAR